MKRLAWIVALAALFFLGLDELAGPREAPTSPALWKTRVPGETLKPGMVVRYQLEALRHADPGDPEAMEQATRVVFRFASPRNRSSTGPLARFASMLQGDAYAPLLGHRAAKMRSAGVCGAYARFEVALTDAAGELRGYDWVLRRVQEGDHSGSWMTEAVVRTPPPVLPEAVPEAEPEGWLGSRAAE